MTREPGPPRVAVVIPCFNDGATLMEAVRSVCDADDREVVIVNDGSTDAETLEVLEGIDLPGVRVVHQENSGLSAARMTGVGETTAPLVCPLDSDDMMAPGALDRLAEALESDPSAVMAWGDQLTFGALDLHQARPDRLDPWSICYVNQIPGGASMIRRHALIEAGGWQMQTAYEDWDLLMSFAERGWEGIHVGITTLHYRIAEEGRMLSTARRDHHERLYEELRSRHAGLFAARPRNWRRSPAPWRMRLAYPLVDALPISQLTKQRAYLVVAEPLRTVRVRRQRFARRRIRAGD